MHEQSETYQVDDEFINVYGKALPNAGQQLPGTPRYKTQAEALAAAEARSKSFDTPRTSLDDALAAVAETPEGIADTQGAPSYHMPKPGRDPFDSSLDELVGQRDADRLRGSTEVGVKTQPSTAIRVLQLTGKTGLPQDFIERNLDFVEQEAAKQNLNPTTLLKDSPALAQWMAEHPDHVAAAQPDAPALSFIEKQLRNIPAQFKQGQRTVEYSDVMLGIVQGLLDKTDVTALRKRQAELEADMGQPDPTGLAEMTGVPGVAQRAPGWMAQQLPILGRTLEEQVEMGAKGVVGGALLGGAAGGPPGAAAGGVIVGGAMWRLGAAQASAKMEFAQAFGEYEKLKDAEGNPLDQQTAMGLAGIVGVVNGTIDGFFGIEGLTSKLPGINQFTRQGIKDLLATPSTSRALLAYARMVGQTMAVEGITEAIQMYITKAGGVALQAVKDGGSPVDWLGKVFNQENLAQALTEAEAGAMGGGGIATVLGAPKLGADIARVRAANRTEKELQRIGEATASTKFHVELPEHLRDIIDRATKDGPVETMYVPEHAFREYFQKQGADPRAVYRELTGDVDAYDQAVTTGGDLPITTADYVQKLAGTKHNKFFAHEMRTSVDAMNAWEAAEWVKEQDEADKAAAAQPGLMAAPVVDEAAKVKQDITGQLISAGYDPTVAENYAALFESRYRARAERRGLGESPAELFARENLQVTRPIPEVLRKVGQTTELDALLNRMRLGDVPLPAEVFGQSLMDFLRERGGVQDLGGELKARDIDRARKPFQKGLIKKEGKTLDEAALAAFEAGYLPKRDIGALLAALGEETAGRPVFAPGKERAAALDVQQNIDSLRAYLESKGIDVATVTNEDVKRLLGEAIQAPLPGMEGQTFAQLALPGPAPTFFSKLERVVAEKMGNKMPATDLRKMLVANGVKEEELKWTGLDEFLKDKGTVTKEEVSQFLSTHLVTIKPVMLGGPTGMTEEQFFDKYDAQITQLRNMGWHTTVTGEDVGQVERVGFIEIDPTTRQEIDGDIVTWDDLPDVQPGVVSDKQIKEALGTPKTYDLWIAGSRTDARILELSTQYHIDILPTGNVSEVHVYYFNGYIAHIREREMLEAYEFDAFVGDRFIKTTIDDIDEARRAIYEAIVPPAKAKPARRTDAQIKEALGEQEIIRLNDDGLPASRAAFDRYMIQPDQFEGTTVTRVYGYTLPGDGGTAYFWLDEGQYVIPVAGAEEMADSLPEARRILYEEFVAPEILGVQASRFGTSDSPQEIAHFLFNEVENPPAPSGSAAPKFGSWQMKPGEGVNYREVLLTLPTPMLADFPKTPEGRLAYDAAVRMATPFTAGHYPQLNVLTHVRINDRVDEQGRKVMFVEEIQSDWHQKARDVRKAEVKRRAEEAGVKKGDLAFKDIEASVPVDFGYKKKWKPAEVDKFRIVDIEPHLRGEGSYVVFDGQGNAIATPAKIIGRTKAEALKAIEDKALSGELHGADKFPAAPFMKTEQWATLALKWLLRHAVEGGYDVMAWTPGAVQNTRYSLSKQIDQIRYEKNEDGTYHLWVKPIGSSETDAIRNTDLTAVPVGQLSDIVGKDVAEKIVSGFQSQPTTTVEHPAAFSVADMETATGAKLIAGLPEMTRLGFPESPAGIRWSNGAVEGYASADAAVRSLEEEYRQVVHLPPPRPAQIVGQNVITGLDLDVAGGGMKSFYDKLVPNVLKDLGKKWGAKVEPVELAGESAIKPGGKVNLHLRDIDPDDWDAYQGAEGWSDADNPKFAEVTFRVSGHEYEGHLIIAKGGVTLAGIGTNDETFTYYAPMEQLVEHERHWRTGTQAIKIVQDRWNNINSTLWEAMTLVEGEPFPENTGDIDAIGPVPGRETPVEVQGMPLTEKMKEAVPQGFPLFQGGEQPKGSITFGNQSISIQLLQKADLSTFIHETGHLYLNELIEDATTAGVTPQLTKDLDTVLKWMGLEVTAASGTEAVKAAVQTAQHEQFARGFEAYAMEGKSPSQAMREVFATFRRWLIQVYRSLITAPLNVKLTREVRQVMDRMIATDEEIDRAAAEQEVHPLFTDAESAGMTPTQFDAYRDTVTKASLLARETLQKQLMAQYERERQAWWKERRAEKVAAVTADVNDQNVYVALSVLQTGKLPDGSPLPEGVQPMKLDRKAIREQMGWDFLKSMPPGTTKNKGMHPETAAPLFGYNTGQGLLIDLVNARPKEALIQAEVDQQMAADYGDMRTDGSMAEAARAAVLNDEQEKVIAAEIRALNKKRLEVAPFLRAERTEEEMAQRAGQETLRTMIPTLEDTRELARKILGRTALKNLDPYKYSVVARQASREATKALAKDQFVDAGHFKQRELLNLALFREAVIIQEQVRKAQELFKGLFKADATLAKSRNVDLVNVGRAILAQYGLARPTEKTAAEYLESIKTYDPDLYNQWKPQVDALAPRPLDYRAMTVQEFTKLHEDIQALWLLSRRTQQMKIDKQLVDREQIVEELSAVMAGFTKPQQAQVVGAQTPWAETTMALLSWGSALRRVESWVRMMDAGNITGVFRKYIWTPISEASDTFRAAKKDLLKSYLELIQPIEDTLTRDLIPAPELGPEVSFRGKTALLHAILHTGNDSNQSKLLRGYKWDPANWTRFLERMYRERVLTPKDYTFAQGLWDLLEEIKPQAQQAHHEMYGYYFSEITARPVVTPFGTYRGGYIPAIADRVQSVDQAIREEKDLFDQAGNSFMFPTTGRGFTKARVEQYAAPLALDMTAIPVHLDKTMRFVHLEPRIKDAARLVTNKTFRQGLDAMNSTVAKDMLVPWLQRSAQQTVSTPGRNRHADALFRELRKRVGAQIMVGNVINTLQQVPGLFTAATLVKPRYLRGAMMSYLRHPITYAEEISTKSAFMRGRTATQVIEIQQSIDDILLNPTKYDQLRKFMERHGYFMQQGTQNLVDLITWGAAYDQAAAQDLDDTTAVRSADSAVRLTQGSFAPETLSSFEAGTPFARAFTMFYSYFNMQANLLTTEMQIVAQNMGLRKGAGRALWIYTMGFMIPAMLSEAIIRGLGGFDPDDDDDYINEALSIFFGSQLRTALAMIPAVGPLTLAGIGAFTSKQYDDRISTSPIVTVLEAAVRTPHSIYMAMSEDGHTKRAIRDLLTFLGLVTGLPLGALARPAGYLGDVTDGVAQPEGAADVARGLVSGKDVNRTK